MMNRIKNCPCDPIDANACRTCGPRYDSMTEQILVPLRPDWSVLEIDDVRIVLGKK